MMARVEDEVDSGAATAAGEEPSGCSPGANQTVCRLNVLTQIIMSQATLLHPKRNPPA